VIVGGQDRLAMAADYWTEDEARRVLGQLDASGLTAAEFGRRRGIAEKRLRWWRKRLGQRSRSVGEALAMVPVRIKLAAGSPTPAAAPPIEVVVGDLVVRVPAGFDAETLARIVGVLGPC
jgi:hypothetical protein